MAQSLGTLLVDIKGDTTQLINSFNKAETAVNKTTKQMSYAVKGLIGAFVGLNTLDLAKNFTKQMDMITEANNKLLLATKNTQEFTTAQKELFRVAQATNQGFSETVDLYSNLALSMGEMGKSQAEVIRTVETVNKAIAISGSNAQQSAAAVLQLGQAFGSGKLGGDELSSLTENSKGLVRAIAQGMGVAVGQLKELGSQGKITSEVLYQALAKMAGDVDEKFGNTNKSVSQGFNNLTNSVSVLAGQFGNAIGFGDGFASTLFKISNYLDTNKDDIINYGIVTTATISKVVDNFMLLGADIKNVAELLLDSVGIMAFGALKSVSSVLLEITKGLNEINLSSDESLANAQSLFDFAEKGFTNFKQSAVNNIQDIDNAYQKANVSIEDRIKLMQKEYKFQPQETKKTPTVETTKKEIKTTQKATKAIQEKIDITQKAKDIQKESMSADDWKSYYETIGNYENAWLIEQSELYSKYKDLTQEEMANVLQIAKKEYFDKFKEEQKEAFNFTIDLDNLDTPTSKVLSTMDKLNEAQQEYNKYIKQSGLTKEEIAKADEKNISNQIKGYSNVAGAIGSLFENGSREMAMFQTAQMSLALVEGTRAVLTSATGDPYTAIPRMIAMGAMVSSLLSNIGVAFGMGGSSTSNDAFSSQTANTGTGSTLGDTSKASESINNALSTLEDFAEPQYQTLLSMNNYLEAIATNIGGVTSLLIRSGGFKFGEGYTGFDTGFKNNIDVGTFINPINSIISKIPVIGQVNEIFGNVINSVLGGVFGKTSTSQALTDSGIYFADTLLTSAINQFNGSAFQTIATTVSKKSWLGSSSNTYIDSYFQALDDETERQFSLVLDNLYSTVIVAGQALDSTQAQIENSLSNFVVSLGKISLKDKTGEQIQESLTAIFGEVGDDIAKTAFPLLTSFQQIGEGLFETLTRVATGMEESKFYIDRLGISTIKYTDIVNKQGVVGFEALSQSIIKADEAVYGLNNGVVQMIDNMDSTAEELYATYLSFGNIRDILEATSQSASNLSSSMVLGAGSISDLESGTKSYMENFLSDSERLNIQLENLSDEFKIAGYEMPKTRQGFINLINSIDTSTEKGAKAYGRLITLSDDYNDTITEIEDNLSSLISVFSNLGDSVSQTIKTLAGADTDSQSATAQIKDFWEKRKEIDSLLALNGNLTESQQSRLGDLVGEINSLAINIQGQDTVSKVATNELINSLTTLESSLNLEEQILSVNIVGVASNVALVANDTRLNTTVPNLITNTSNFVTSDYLSTEIKDILTTIKNNLSTYPQKTYDILDDVINGNYRVKVQTN